MALKPFSWFVTLLAPTLALAVAASATQAKHLKKERNQRPSFAGRSAEWAKLLSTFDEARRSAVHQTIRDAYAEALASEANIEAKAVGGVQLAALIGVGTIFLIGATELNGWPLAFVYSSVIYLTLGAGAAGWMLQPRLHYLAGLTEALEDQAGVPAMAASIEYNETTRRNAVNFVDACYKDLARSTVCLVVAVFLVLV